MIHTYNIAFPQLGLVCSFGFTVILAKVDLYLTFNCIFQELTPCYTEESGYYYCVPYLILIGSKYLVEHLKAKPSGRCKVY